MTTKSTLETVIKSPSRVCQASTPPVIVVGLPRSGSSYLAHVLSCLDDWFIFDDLYPYQKAASIRVSSTFDLSQSPEKLKQFVNRLSWQLWAKIKFEENFQVPNLDLEAPFAMEAVLVELFEQSTNAKASSEDTAQPTASSLNWPEVLEEWMMRLAIHSGKHRWGYKTPQDFMHMDELADLFPGVKFIYILRDPRKMMRSFKNLPRVKTDGSQDGESRQYHPAVYALYWKKAYEKVQDFTRRGRAPVEVVKFEDLVQSPEAVASRLAEFLETTVTGNVVAERANSSMRNGSPIELTNTEIALCEKIAGTCMKSAGYQLAHTRPKVSDIFELLKISATFSRYQVERILTNKKARTSVIAFIKSLITSG